MQTIENDASKKRIRDAMDRVFEINEEGLESLKNEDYAEKRRSETILNKYSRVLKRKLGVKKNKSVSIHL